MVSHGDQLQFLQIYIMEIFPKTSAWVKKHLPQKVWPPKMKQIFSHNFDSSRMCSKCTLVQCHREFWSSHAKYAKYFPCYFHFLNFSEGGRHFWKKFSSEVINMLAINNAMTKKLNLIGPDLLLVMMFNIWGRIMVKASRREMFW